MRTFQDALPSSRSLVRLSRDYHETIMRPLVGLVGDYNGYPLTTFHSNSYQIRPLEELLRELDSSTPRVSRVFWVVVFEIIGFSLISKNIENVNLQKTTPQKTPNTPGVERPSSPRGVVHF